jgi:hypothetical protein
MRVTTVGHTGCALIGSWVGCAPSRNNARTAQSVPADLVRRESVHWDFLTFPHSTSWHSTCLPAGRSSRNVRIATQASVIAQLNGECVIRNTPFLFAVEGGRAEQGPRTGVMVTARWSQCFLIVPAHANDTRIAGTEEHDDKHALSHTAPHPKLWRGATQRRSEHEIQRNG